MPDSKESWLALILMIVIPVAIIGPLAGYSVNGVTLHDPTFIFQLMAFSIDSVPVVVTAFIDFLVLMTVIIVFQMVGAMSATGTILLGAVGLGTALAVILAAIF